MSLIRRLARRGAPRGSLILPREETRGLLNWPRCEICKLPVHAYGLENDSDALVEIRATCHGQEFSANGVPNSARRHPSMTSSIVIHKGPDWSQNRMTDIISRLAFFADEAYAGREFQQDTSEEGVR